MEYNHYITVRRARIVGICGEVNIPYGTEIEAADGFLLFEGKPLCATDSQNAYDYFAANDDGCGLERGKLTRTIIDCLAKRDNGYQKRWDIIWEDTLCPKYRRSDHEDHWLWNYDFYHAPILDLYHIAGLIGVRVK